MVPLSFVIYLDILLENNPIDSGIYGLSRLTSTVSSFTAIGGTKKVIQQHNKRLDKTFHAYFRELTVGKVEWQCLGICLVCQCQILFPNLLELEVSNLKLCFVFWPNNSYLP